LLQDFSRRDTGTGLFRLAHGLNNDKRTRDGLHQDQRRLTPGNDGREMPQLLDKRIERRSHSGLQSRTSISIFGVSWML
jgi:hypothetical protein